MALSKYRELFQIPHAKPAIFSSLIARTAYGMLGLCLILWVTGERGVALAGLLAGANGLGSAGFATPQGILIDRLGPRKTLGILTAGCLLFFSLLILGIDSGFPAAFLIPLAFLAGTCEPPNLMVMRVFWFKKAPEYLQKTAFAWEGMVASIAYSLSPLLTSLLVATTSPRLAFLVAVALTVITPLVFVLGPALKEWERVLKVKGSRLWRSPKLVTKFFIYICVMSLLSGMLPILAELGHQRGTPELAPLMVACVYPGLLLGGLWFGSWHRGSSYLLLLRACGLLTLVFGLLLIELTYLTLAVSMALLGFARGPITPILNLLISKLAPSDRLGEAQGISSTAIYLGLALGPSLTGVLTAAFGLRAGVAGLAGLSLIVSALALRLFRTEAATHF